MRSYATSQSEMEFSSFRLMVRDEVDKRTGDNYNVRIDEVVKNNGIVLSGLTVMKDDSNISPTIYLEEFYKSYINDDVSIKSIVDDIMEIYNRNKVNRSVDIQCFTDYDSIRERIVYKLINTEKNKEQLMDIPHVEFLDLSIVFECLVTDRELGNATILIRNSHMRMWDVTTETLYRQACINTPRLNKYCMTNICDVICEIMENAENDSFDRDSIEELGDVMPMYVLTNKRKLHGAACILYPELMKDLATALRSGFYIIPSSIQEVLIIPDGEKVCSGNIIDIIKEVNDTQVDPEEILSYSVYFYDMEAEEIKIVNWG